ncbi:MAG TPA: hypothetical protein VGB55_04375 [Tepidisphaeraceae bacterium]|jgi:hypothetical protein
MTQCFRNTRPVIEIAFNILYGSYAANKVGVPTKESADLAALEGKDLIWPSTRRMYPATKAATNDIRPLTESLSAIQPVPCRYEMSAEQPALIKTSDMSLHDPCSLS